MHKTASAGCSQSRWDITPMNLLEKAKQKDSFYIPPHHFACYAGNALPALLGQFLMATVYMKVILQDCNFSICKAIVCTNYLYLSFLLQATDY
jgi:hypothetical protein